MVTWDDGDSSLSFVDNMLDWFYSDVPSFSAPPPPEKATSLKPAKPSTRNDRRSATALVSALTPTLLFSDRGVAVWTDHLHVPAGISAAFLVPPAPASFFWLYSVVPSGGPSFCTVGLSPPVSVASSASALPFPGNKGRYLYAGDAHAPVDLYFSSIVLYANSV
jgi:hypothetical protein